MIISQNEKKITGYTIISLIENSKIFGKISFSGTFKNSILHFEEKKILAQNRKTNNFYWCIKEGDLYYSETTDSLILKGNWKSEDITCPPGTITVKKVNLTQKQDNYEDNNISENDRKLKQGIDIKIPQKEIIIMICELAKEDNDTVSLIFNNDTILSHYRLTKNYKKIIVNYNPDKKNNKLILFAHNEGYVSPNTAKLKIISGNMQKTILLKSNLEESDLIYFEYEQ